LLANNTASENVEGIYLSTDTDNNTIRDNNASNNVYGIFLTYTTNNTITNNTAGSNTCQGIHLNHSTDNLLADNLMSGNSYGIFLSYTGDNTITNNTASSNAAQGIHLNHSTDNLLANNTACGSVEGIYLSSDIDNTTIRDNNASNNVYGIFLTDTSNNTITNNTANDNTNQGIHLNHSSHSRLIKNRASGNTYGIFLSVTTSNTVANNTINSNTLEGIHLDHTNVSHLEDNIASLNNIGIYLDNSGNNSLTNNTVNSNRDAGFSLTFSGNNTFDADSACNNTNYDFYSDEYAHNNEAENFFLISSYPTMVSFTYDHGIGLKSVESPHPDPGGWQNISKYVMVTNVTGNSWLFLNVSYSHADLAGVNENTMVFDRWLAGAWTQIPGSGVNTVENYVDGNITGFGQVAPFGRSGGFGAPPVAIGIEQPDFVDPQSQFTVNITVDPQANDISAVQYDLYYNTSVVWAEWANPGMFLKQAGADTDVTVLAIENSWDVSGHTGKISYAETILRSGGVLPSVNTSGVLTTIHFSAIGARGACSYFNLSDVLIADPDKGPVDCTINNCGVTIYDNIPPVANGTSMHRVSNVASKFQCFAILCPCLSHGGGDTWKGNNITYIRWDFGDGEYGTSEGVDPCEDKEHEYTTWNWNGTGYDPFIVYLTVRDDGDPQLSNTTEVEVVVYIAGDTNGDGVVDIFDAACVGKHWGQAATGPAGTCGYLWTDLQADEADLNNDNEVDTIDAMIVGTNWNHLAYPPYIKE